MLDIALEAGAEDVVSHEDGSLEVITSPDSFNDVREALETAKLVADDAEITMVPSVKAEVDAEHVVKFLNSSICWKTSTMCKTSTTMLTLRMT